VIDPWAAAVDDLRIGQIQVRARALEARNRVVLAAVGSQGGLVVLADDPQARVATVGVAVAVEILCLFREIEGVANSKASALEL
jgi:hypothetical protein